MTVDTLVNALLAALLSIVITVLAWAVHEVVELGKLLAGLQSSHSDLQKKVDGHDAIYTDLNTIKQDVAFIRGKMSNKDD